MLSLLLMFACTGSSDGPPPRPDGTFLVRSVAMAGAEIDGPDAITGNYPGCSWGQELFTFSEGELRREIAVLCPQKGQIEAHGCEVSTVATATWDAAKGVFTVAQPVKARARFASIKEGQPPRSMAACSVTLDAGEYPIARIYNGLWKWEVRTPDGTVHRLDAGPDEPDFAAAMLELTQEE
jgi:hypothetical protein